MYYLDRSLDHEKSKVKLFKLHGSINWWRLGASEVVKCQSCDSVPHPVSLIGMDNKRLDYGFGIISEMHYRFHEVLHYKGINTIVISGFGWNDRGIYAKLLDWLDSSKDNRIYILHENRNELIQQSICPRLDNHSQIKFINKWLSGINLDELLEVIVKR